MFKPFLVGATNTAGVAVGVVVALLFVVVLVALIVIIVIVIKKRGKTSYAVKEHKTHSPGNGNFSAQTFLNLFEFPIYHHVMK